MRQSWQGDGRRESLSNSRLLILPVSHRVFNFPLFFGLKSIILLILKTSLFILSSSPLAPHEDASKTKALCVR
jgi:hypothetical protein